jgi:hypothetical protein
LIKHFNIWPIGFEKDNLFEEQKIFLIYLMGFVHSLEEWNLQVTYQKRLQDINNLSLKDINLEKTDIDLAKMHGRDLYLLKKERLKEEKKKKIKELNEKFGIEDEEKKEKNIKFKEENPHEKQKTLWDMLELKKIIKKEETNGL